MPKRIICPTGASMVETLAVTLSSPCNTATSYGLAWAGKTAAAAAKKATKRNNPQASFDLLAAKLKRW
ncbi:MAG: hypothetical protein QF511_00795 [Rhodospirillales bacterium]|nr:hypothetical protein [Rhodospirillales bacterium]